MLFRSEVIAVSDRVNKPIDVETAFRIALDPDIKIDGENVIPSKQLYIPINKEDVLNSGTLDSSRIHEVVPQILIDINKSRLTKSELMVIEMLKENKWKRPIYFAVTVGDDYYLGLNDHFELTGMAYQVMPVSTNGKGAGVNTDEMYENMMHKFRWGNIADPKVYIDENSMRMCRTHRMMFSQLIGALIQENDTVRAKKALDYAMEVIPGTTVRHDYTSALLAEYYYALGEFKKGNEIMDFVAGDCLENLEWYFSLSNVQRKSVESRIGHNFGVLNHVLRAAEQYGQTEIVGKYYAVFEKLSQRVRM